MNDEITPEAQRFAALAVATAELDRRKAIGRRTTANLLARREQGLNVGRRSALPETLVARIVRERETGATLTAIADRLNEEGIPTGQKLGARWYPSTVRNVLSGQVAERVRSQTTWAFPDAT